MCVSVSNRGSLPNKASCEAAARSVGLDAVTAHVFSSSSYPPGCFFHAAGASRILHYNTLSTSTAPCNSAGSAFGADFCLCVAAPDCTETNGATENTATCMCGGMGCTAASGRFCTSSTSTCSSGDPASAPAPAPSVSYFIQSSGTCASNNGLMITDRSNCLSASTILGFARDNFYTETGSSSHPAGCTWRNGSPNPDNNLFFNPNSGSSETCSSEFECLCKTDSGGDSATAPAPSSVVQVGLSIVFDLCYC